MQHKELLQPGRGGTITDGKMVNVALQRAQAYLPDLVVTGVLCTLPPAPSSFSLSSGPCTDDSCS